MKIWKVAEDPREDSAGRKSYVCFYETEKGKTRRYDTCLFKDKEEAARRCRALNGEQVWGWNRDGHPQSC